MPANNFILVFKKIMTAQRVSWQRLAQQAEGLLSVSSDQISNAANLSALIYQELPDVSWVGFYFLNDEKLLLGPFRVNRPVSALKWVRGFAARQQARVKHCV